MSHIHKKQLCVKGVCVCVRAPDRLFLASAAAILICCAAQSRARQKKNNNNNLESKRKEGSLMYTEQRVLARTNLDFYFDDLYLDDDDDSATRHLEMRQQAAQEH